VTNIAAPTAGRIGVSMMISTGPSTHIGQPRGSHVDVLEQRLRIAGADAARGDSWPPPRFYVKSLV
jgi:hypothetical protein